MYGISFVSDETRLELAAVVVDTVTRGEDRLFWGQTNNGQFTVKSVYDLITQDDVPGPHMHGGAFQKYVACSGS